MVLVEVSLKPHKYVVVLDRVSYGCELLWDHAIVKEVCHLAPIVLLWFAGASASRPRTLLASSDRDVGRLGHVVLWGVVLLCKDLSLARTDLTLLEDAIARRCSVIWLFSLKSSVAKRHILLEILVLEDGLHLFIL
jgi:hypothetical protein